MLNSSTSRKTPEVQSELLVWSASASLSITLLKGRPLSLKLSLVLSSRQKPPLSASVCVRSGVTRTAVSSVTCDTMALTGVCSSLSLCCPLSGSSSFLEETIFNLPLVAGNYFRPRGPKISVTRTRLCHCSVEAAGARTSTLCMDTGMRISETSHIMKYRSGHHFSNHLKMWPLTDSTYHGQGASQIWLTSRSLWTPDLGANSAAACQLSRFYSCL